MMTQRNWQSLPGPQDITRFELENGIVVLTRPNYSSPSVRISGYLPAGSINDPKQKLGLADFTSTALMRGTQSHSFQEIYDSLESNGASLGFGTNVHSVSFGGKSLAEDLPLLMRTLLECLAQPIFPPVQVERLRAQILASLAIRDQQTDEMASLAFDQVVFGEHPYGNPIDGYRETVLEITQSDMVDFHNRYYGPQGMVIAVVGGVSSEQVVDEVRSALEGWRNSHQEFSSTPAMPKKLERTYRRHIQLDEKSQSDLSIGTLGPDRFSEDYLSASLGNNILGRFGMMGRIGDVVREQSGLAYYASANLSSSILAGSWEVSAGVNPKNLERAIDLILQEIRRFVEEPVTQEELEDNQSNYIGRLPLLLESNAGVASALINMEQFNLGLDYYQKYADRVKAVTPESILAVAQKYLDPERLAICSAGMAMDHLESMGEG